MILVVLLSGIVFSEQLGDITASPSLCVLRSTQGDQIAPCSNTTVIGQCPNDSSVYLTGENCCQSNQYFSDMCEFQLKLENVSSTSVPVVRAENITHLVQILTRNGSAIINSTHLETNCSPSSIENIDPTGNPQFLSLNLSEEENSSAEVVPSGVYKLNLTCNMLPSTTIGSQCLYIRLASSMEESTMENSHTGNGALGTCPINPTSEPTFNSTTSVMAGTTTEELSLWLRYNRLLIYVVSGGGVGVGLLLVFIIMLCVLTGCIARRRRKREQRRHQLETAPSVRRQRSRITENSRCQRNLSYTLPNYNEEQGEHIEYVKVSTKTDLQEPQPFPQLQPVKAEIPLVPTLEAASKKEDEVTFDTFKRSRSGSKLAQPDTPMTDTIQQGYYESIVPTIKSTDEKDTLTESYNILDRGLSQSKDHPLTKSKSDYSQLNQVSSILNPHSLATPSPQTRPLSPTPIPPPLPSMELLRPHNKFPQDILTSSWSKPQEMDRMVSQSTPELLEIYDSPTELAFTRPKPPRPIKRARGRYIIGEGDSEVIYDIPPIRKISDDTSIGSYVDMQSQFFML